MGNNLVGLRLGDSLRRSLLSPLRSNNDLVEVLLACKAIAVGLYSSLKTDAQ
jgi:hypothetical protein